MATPGDDYAAALWAVIKSTISDSVRRRYSLSSLDGAERRLRRTGYFSSFFRRQGIQQKAVNYNEQTQNGYEEDQQKPQEFGLECPVLFAQNGYGSDDQRERVEKE